MGGRLVRRGKGKKRQVTEREEGNTQKRDRTKDKKEVGRGEGRIVVGDIGWGRD